MVDSSPEIYPAVCDLSPIMDSPWSEEYSCAPFVVNPQQYTSRNLRPSSCIPSAVTKTSSLLFLPQLTSENVSLIMVPRRLRPQWLSKLVPGPQNNCCSSPLSSLLKYSLLTFSLIPLSTGKWIWPLAIWFKISVMFPCDSQSVL